MLLWVVASVWVQGSRLGESLRGFCLPWLKKWLPLGYHRELWAKHLFCFRAKFCVGTHIFAWSVAFHSQKFSKKIVLLHIMYFCTYWSFFNFNILTSTNLVHWKSNGGHTNANNNRPLKDSNLTPQTDKPATVYSTRQCVEHKSQNYCICSTVTYKGMYTCSVLLIYEPSRFSQEFKMINN